MFILQLEVLLPMNMKQRRIELEDIKLSITKSIRIKGFQNIQTHQTPYIFGEVTRVI